MRKSDSPRPSVCYSRTPLTSAGGEGGCAASPANSNLCTKKRYRAGQGRNDYTYFAHDLAVGPAVKFQFVAFRVNPIGIKLKKG